MTKWLRQRIVTLLFSALIIAAAPQRPVEASYCPYPWDAESACYDFGGWSIGCTLWSNCFVCCQAICEVYNYETEAYEYWGADYHWCDQCCWE